MLRLRRLRRRKRFGLGGCGGTFVEFWTSWLRSTRRGDRGLEIREVAGGFRFATKPEYHDAVRGFVKSLKPPLKLTLQALETLAVVAYKQPVTSPEISEIRGRRFERRAGLADCAQADHDGWTEARDRAPDSVQDDARSSC